MAVSTTIYTIEYIMTNTSVSMFTYSNISDTSYNAIYYIYK